MYKKGRTDVFFSAIYLIYNFEGVNKERLYKKISAAMYEMVPAGTVEGYLNMFTEIYNKDIKKKSNKIDFLHEYKYA